MGVRRFGCASDTTRSARCTVRRRAQLGREELSSQLVFLMPLIFIHQIRFILEALLQPIGPRVP